MQQVTPPYKCDIMLIIRCLAYNHAAYIRQTLDGFVMQQTNFKFVAVVHDDASTDGTADIIREYAEKYPDIIVPILEKENLYSKADGSLRRVMLEATRSVGAKYCAICEGDDYWTDPLKLQRQVDYMEAHPECSMTCTAAKRFSDKREMFLQDVRPAQADGPLRPEDIIMEGGLYIATCSIVLRTDLLFSEAYNRDYIKKCHVGDYPLQIFCAMRGEVYYFNDPMSVYRVDNGLSWGGRVAKASVQKRISGHRSECRLLEGFAKDYPKYRNTFLKTLSMYVACQYHSGMAKEDYRCLNDGFAEFRSDIMPLWRLNIYFKQSPIFSAARDFVTGHIGILLMKIVKRH